MKTKHRVEAQGTELLFAGIIHHGTEYEYVLVLVVLSSVIVAPVDLKRTGTAL